MEYIPYVNILQGTKSCGRFSHGSTLPLVQLPFAMAGFTLQTDGEQDPWFFNPDSRCLEGIRLTHQPSPWIGDYGTLLWMPQTGEPESIPEQRWSDYAPERTELRPDYMRVEFRRSRARLELSPTERGCGCVVDFPEDAPAYISFFVPRGYSQVEWHPDSRRLTGFTTAHGTDDTKDFRMYFVVEPEEGAVDPERTRVIADGETRPGLRAEGAAAGIHLALTGRHVFLRLAISYISPAQAEENLRQERRPGGFAAIRERARQSWEDMLSRAAVTTETDGQLRTFYSCLYRCFLFPHAAYETAADGTDLHFVPSTGGVAPGRRYTDTGFWDTYRTQFPLLSILAPEHFRDMVEGFVREYTESGWLPRWLSMGEIGSMPGTLVDAVIADGAVKGLLGRETLETALRGMLHHANVRAEKPCHGRAGVEDYRRYGYVPDQPGLHTVNQTLDAAYGDFCIAQVAKCLGDSETETAYRERARNYRRLFDPQTGFMRARDTAGRFAEPFDSREWGGPYCEANAWQTTFAVQHDIPGLAALFGGAEAMTARLDALFAEPPDYAVGAYGQVIHEMAEAVDVHLGQCAMNNQPSFHLPFLFAALGHPEKTDHWVRIICDTLFSSRPDGFPGDEDNGSMAAWYVFAMLGFYPLCPGRAEYIRTRPLVTSARLAGRERNTGEDSVWIPHDRLLR